MSIKAILFDLDGVLVDACELHYKSLNLALLDYGCFAIQRNDHEVLYNGLPTKMKLQMMDLTEEAIEAISEKKQEFTISAIEELINQDRVKITMMQDLIDAGYRIACVTNSIRKTAVLMLECAEISEYIEQIISNEDVTLPKPRPEGYLRAMIELGVGPKECLIVEDSDKGFAAANAASATVWRVKDPSEVTSENIMKVLEECKS